MKRRFSSRERVALFLGSDGRCAGCGRELEIGWHADHIQPWSRGGATDVVNAQALCPDCNRRKGVSMSGLRKWQLKAIQEFITEPRADFLIEATPAAGKTRMAAEIAARLYAGAVIARIIVVVPTRRLRKQTADKYRYDCGLQLDYEWAPGNSVFPGGEFCGVVVTYHAVTRNAALFRSFCKIPTLVILDEIHHANIDQTWGTELRQAFEPAVHRLLLSGTPFRSDNGAIPFVRYVDGKGVADFTYGYGDALTDEIVRAVFFPRTGGTMEWIEDTGRQIASFEDDLDERGQSRRLRTALMVDGDHLITIIAQAHRELLQMREDDPDAAGLIVAMDQFHAQAIRSRIDKELGISSFLAISDEPEADEVIEAFEKGIAPWIVAVKMVSEGVDIPRLRVCVFASNIVTEMFFRQVVGRVARRQDDHDQHWAHVYIPDDPRLRQFAADIREQREAVLDEDTSDKSEPREPREPSIFTPLRATAEDAGIIAGDYVLSREEFAHAERVKLLDPQTAPLSTVALAIFLRRAGGFGPPPAEKTPPEDLTARIKKMRQQNDKVAKRVAMRHNIEFREVNNSLNRLVGIRTIRQCSNLSVLERRLEIAERWLRFGDLSEAAGA